MRPSGNITPCGPPPPTRQAWSSLRSSVLAGVGGVEQQCDLAGAGGGFDPSAPLMSLPARASMPSRSSADWRSAASIRSPRSAGTATSLVLNARGERALELALGVGCIELGAVDADPGAAARRPGADVGRDLAVGAEREPDQLVLRALAAR